MRSFILSREILSCKSIKQIKAIVHKLECHRTHLMPYEEYFKLMAEALSEITAYTLDEMLDFKNEGYGIFRARQVYNDDPYLLIEDMWAKPDRLVMDYGRCNNIKESRFYCSNFFLTCLVECRAKENTKWVLAEYEPVEEKKILTLPIGINEHIFKNRGVSHLNPDQKKKNEILLRFIRNSYKKVISASDTKRYLKTIAITDFFFNSDQLKGKDACIMYPSVADYYQNVNYVFHPDVAKRNFRVKKAFFLQVVNQDVRKHSHIAKLKFLSNGAVVGDKIIWTENKEIHFKDCLKYK